jgi:hypothetical protein
MWLLLIVLLAPTPGISRATILNTFETYEACQPERDRLGFELAESYPNDADFRIVCEFREKRPSNKRDRQPREEQVLLNRSSNATIFS